MLIYTCRAIALLVLLVSWTCNVPYHQISDFVGSHFPWPETKSLRWAALLIEGALIQIMVSLPVALVVPVIFRRNALAVSIALASIFVIRSFVYLPSTINQRYGLVFIVYLVIVHFILLVGATAIGKRCIDGSNLSLQPSASGVG
jgi:hypothetical protein